MAIEGFETMTDEEKQTALDEAVAVLPEHLRDVPTAVDAAPDRRLRALSYAQLRARNFTEDRDAAAAIEKDKHNMDFLAVGPSNPSSDALGRILGN